MGFSFARRLAAPLAIAGLLIAMAPVASATSTPDAGVRDPRVDARSSGYRQLQHRATVLPRSSRSKAHRAVPPLPPLARPDGDATTPSIPPTSARIARPATVATATPPVLGSRTTAPSAAQPGGWNGLTENSSQQAADAEPPDPFVGVGPDDIVQIVNLDVRITSRTNGQPRPAVAPVETNLLTFFGFGDPPSSRYFDSDPRIAFDSLHGRWIAGEVSWDCAADSVDGAPAATFGHGYLDLAVSRTADPLDGFDIWYLQYVDALPDFPSLGSSSDKIGEGVSVFGMKSGTNGDCVDGSAYQGSDVVVYDWTRLLTLADPKLPKPNVWVDSDPNGFAPRVALQAPATSTTLRVVQEQAASAGFQSEVGYLAYTGSVESGTITRATRVDLSSQGLNVIAAFGDPPQPRQPGGTISAAIDGRPTDAIWQANRLVFVSTYPCDSNADTTIDDCVRVSELATPATASSAPTVRQDFLIADSGTDSYMGGIGLTGTGTLHVVWTDSSSSAAPAIATAYQRTTDPIRAVSSTTVLKTSTAAYGGARWGDYVGVAQDPQVPDAVWQANEYASADGTWATWVSQLQTGGLRYVPITPVRVLDSRPGGTGLAGKFTHGTPRSFAVAGVAGIPTTARAVTGNVTVVGQQAGGYVSITPVSVSAPPSSTINFPTGDIRANNLTATLGAGGKLWAVYRASPSKTTDLVFDVTGYYLDDPSQAAYAPIAPVRMLDTRSPAIGLASPFHGNAPRRLPIGNVSVGGSVRVPNTATAITGNLTVVNQTRSGYVAITTTSQSAPTTSTLNFPVKDVRANGITVPLDNDPTHRGIWLVYRPTGGLTTDTTDLVLDVTGYYTTGGGGADFHPLNPGRTMDTRTGVVLTALSGRFFNGVARSPDIDGRWGVPAGAAAITANLTVVNQTRGGYVAVTKEPPTSAPTTSTINFPLGDIRANGITSGLSTNAPSGHVSLDYLSGLSGTSTDLILDVSGYFK